MLNSPVAPPVASGDVVGQLEFPNSLLSRRLDIPNSKVHGANMGPIWGRQDPGGPHVGPMNPAFWVFGQSLKGNNEKSVTLNWYVLALHNSGILSASISDHYGVFHINVSGHIWINHHIVRSCTWKWTCAIDTQSIEEIQATKSMLTRWYYAIWWDRLRQINNDSLLIYLTIHEKNICTYHTILCVFLGSDELSQCIMNSKIYLRMLSRSYITQ